MGLLALQLHQQPLLSSGSRVAQLPVPPPGLHVAKQRAVLIWTQVSSLSYLHSRRRILSAFTGSNPLSDEGMEISMVPLSQYNLHAHSLPTIVGHFVLAFC